MRLLTLGLLVFALSAPAFASRAHLATAQIAFERWDYD